MDVLQQFKDRITVESEAIAGAIILITVSGAVRSYNSDGPVICKLPISPEDFSRTLIMSIAEHEYEGKGEGEVIRGLTLLQRAGVERIVVDFSSSLASGIPGIPDMPRIDMSMHELENLLIVEGSRSAMVRPMCDTLGSLLCNDKGVMLSQSEIDLVLKSAMTFCTPLSIVAGYAAYEGIIDNINRAASDVVPVEPKAIEDESDTAVKAIEGKSEVVVNQ